MREIKFRVWDLLDKRMIEWGDVFHLPAWEVFPGTPEMRPWEVMQYTGLCDKNGVEIYEDDIVHVIEVFSDRTEEWTNPVVWYGNGWYLFDPHDVGCPLDCFGEGVVSLSEIEVIGNIHENPDLLEAK